MAGMSDVHRLPEKWLPVSIAPADTNLEVGVLDKMGDVVALVYPVRKMGACWVDAVSKKLPISARRIGAHGTMAFNSIGVR